MPLPKNPSNTPGVQKIITDKGITFEYEGKTYSAAGIELGKDGKPLEGSKEEVLFDTKEQLQAKKRADLDEKAKVDAVLKSRMTKTIGRASKTT